MADNLPLIPCKDGVCAEVRPLLRMVFRELDYLPPLSMGDSPEVQPVDKTGDDDHETLPEVEPWTEKLKTECDQIWDQEGEIKHQYAKRLARELLPNIYQLHSPPCPSRQVPKWRLDRGLIDRSDLVPTIEQNAGRDGSLWIKNILNASSGNVREMKDTSAPIVPPDNLEIAEENTIETLSIGINKPFVLPKQPAAVPPLPQPRVILCVPPQLHFVNFVVGHVYTQSIRVINTSKHELRLSIIPPKRRELTVEICGLRGLTITSGAAIKLKIHFRPIHVRALFDEMPVKVSNGETLPVPIACYMQPPILDVVLPNVTSSLLFCSPDERASITPQILGGLDVVELGTQLLGNVHCARMILHSDAKHSAFFVLTEDAWISCNLNCLTTGGSMVSGPFVFWPAWWRGGGVVSARVWCRGDGAGAHLAQLRVLSSTAINRQLYLMADVVLFNRNHIVIEAHSKDYDICIEGDTACEYYVHAGTAFPHRSLTTTIKIINNSPVIYSYYWTTRPWGICWCQRGGEGLQTLIELKDTTDHLCAGAIEITNLCKNDPEAYKQMTENAKLVNIDPGQSQILPRVSCTLQVRIPDVGGKLGVQRAVLMLIVKDIPKESLSDEYTSMIINTKEIETMAIPGVQNVNATREVCEVLVTQMEVWWEVVPVRFVLEPAVFPLPYSRRVNSVSLSINAWQLYGCSESCVQWVMPARVETPPPLRLTTDQSATTDVLLPLTELPNHYPDTDVLTMVAANSEWRRQCRVTRWCATRHPAPRPARAWLGVVPPRTHMQSVFTLTNDTYQRISYWCEGFRWLGENAPVAACRGQIPCDQCHLLHCTCNFLRPRRGSLAKDESTEICYDVYTPEHDGCVATLVQVRRCEPDLGSISAAPATEARASLVAYRVLTPKVILRLLPCFGENPECGTGCGLDAGARGARGGTALLRPRAALVVGRRTCCRLRLTNITPLPTAVSFDEPIDNTDLLQVTFSPSNFSIRSYGTKEIRVVLSARAVCARRVFVYRARAPPAPPLYVLVDTAITGLEITCQVPIGGGPETDEFIIMRRTQKEEGPGGTAAPATPQELFEEEDRKRQIIKENLCTCKFEMVYIPPVKRPEPPCPDEETEHPRVELLTSPPPLTRACPCRAWRPPAAPDAPDSISLQFIQMPLRTVWERRLILQNESAVTARWSCAVRRWARARRRTLDKDEWACGVAPAGVALECAPGGGVLSARARQDLLVRAYADCWGLYWDQILIQVEKLEPIVLDVWVEAVGSPLQVKLQPNAEQDPERGPTLWMSSSEPVRSLAVRNVSRADLVVHAYVTLQHARAQDALPFRLYLRVVDVTLDTCACYARQSSEEAIDEASEATSTVEEEMGTSFELYLAPDHGSQLHDYYQVSPSELEVRAGEGVAWRLCLRAPPRAIVAPSATLLLRARPLQPAGNAWYRAEPAPVTVSLRHAPRDAQLKLSCDQLVVKLCAVNLPHGDFLRVRKHFDMQNIGNGALAVNVHTSLPWCVVHHYDAACDCHHAGERSALVNVSLPPWSSARVCVEACVSTLEAWPRDAPAPGGYELRRTTVTPLRICDDGQVLQTLPLVLDVEYPSITTEPAAVDFGYVTDGASKKTYVTVSHTSHTETLTLNIEWVGCQEFEIWPRELVIPPGGSERLYIQYTAVWRHGAAEGCARLALRGGARGAGRWCRAELWSRAAPTRDHQCGARVRDHTTDTHLLPSAARHWRP